ncbi:MAG TPA: hypothetical protein VET65_08630, partial [Candidatus Limnocylindrales bacterium]|nr:hypothetical protein [Candidatus Limnocylindrales bacterium]
MRADGPGHRPEYRGCPGVGPGQGKTQASARGSDSPSRIAGPSSTPEGAATSGSDAALRAKHLDDHMPVAGAVELEQEDALP